MSEKPDFGPSGYLPERASKRARKIVLRAPLGLQWVIGSIVAGVVVVVAGLLWLSTSSQAPGEPFVAYAPVDELRVSRIVDDPTGTTLIVTAGGRVRAFDVTDLAVVPAYCESSNRIETDDRAWSLTGRGLGVSSLDEHPAVVFDGVLYVDFTSIVEGPPASDEVVEPVC